MRAESAVQQKAGPPPQPHPSVLLAGEVEHPKAQECRRHLPPAAEEGHSLFTHSPTESTRGKSIHSGWPNSLPMKLR